MYNKEGLDIRNNNIKLITDLFYESGRHDRSLRWIWINYIYPIFGLTYNRYLQCLKDCPATNDKAFHIMMKVMTRYMELNADTEDVVKQKKYIIEELINQE